MKELRDLINDGSRPSRLDLGRLWSGEAGGEEAARLRQAAASGPAAEHLTALDATRARVAPFDAEILRKGAERCRAEDEAERARREREAERARRAPRWSWRWIPVAAAAAVAALFVFVTPPPDGPGGHRSKGEGDLDFYVLRGEQVHPGSEEELHHPGDRVQFTYRTAGEGSLVVLSVDGRGQVSVYYPAEGDRPLAVSPGERRVLDGSIELDDAPDFELILAFFGADSVSEVLDEVAAIRDERGIEGLIQLARDAPDVDAIYLRKGVADVERERP